MNTTSKIYIAGHTGLVGSAFSRLLTDKGYENIVTRTSSELDLRCQEEVEKFFKKEKPEYVFLAAAKVGGILANSTYKADFIYDNIAIATNVIHASWKHGVKKLLNLGSSCIYPKNAPQPIKEEYLLTGVLEPTNEPYAIAKIAAIKLCKYYNEQYGTKFISVMPTNLYGPNDNYDLETSHVLAAFIRKFHLAKLLAEEKYDEIRKDLQKHGNPPTPVISTEAAGRVERSNKLTPEQINAYLVNFGITKDTVTLWGTGTPYREFLHVDDLADACMFLMNKYDHKDIGEFINIGTGKDIQIRDLADIIKNTIGFEGQIVWDNTKPDGTSKKLSDVSKMKDLGWEACVEMNQGTEEAYKNFRM